MKEKFKLLYRRDFLKFCSQVAASGFFYFVFGIENILSKETKQTDSPEKSFAMGIDIHKCIGCGRCADACKKENKVPKEPRFFRTWVERFITSTGGETNVESPNGGIDGFSDIEKNADILKTYFVPKLCNHCDKPPCVQVCPVGATYKTRDGVILVDENYCVGCRYCIQACPYGARYMHPEKHVADKCTFCYHRINKGLLPACVEVCPTQARVFGEFGRRSSPITRFVRFNNINVLKPELNTDPQVFYAGAGREVR